MENIVNINYLLEKYEKKINKKTKIDIFLFLSFS